jgi:hypothetical protein
LCITVKKPNKCTDFFADLSGTALGIIVILPWDMLNKPKNNFTKKSVSPWLVKAAVGMLDETFLTTAVSTGQNPGKLLNSSVVTA